MPTSRGENQYPDRARQLRNFSGLLFGNITPTDIDGLIEYHDKGYIFIETKLEGAPFPEGQRIALERITDDLNRNGKRAVCIIAEHSNYDVKEDIDVASAIVSKYRYKHSWNTPKDNNITTKEFITKFINLIRGDSSQ